MIPAISAVARIVPRGAWKMLAIVLAVALSVGAIHWKYTSMKNKIEKLEAQNIASQTVIDSQDEQIGRLRASVTTQNDRIKSLGIINDTRLKMIIEAREEAEQTRAIADRAITELNRAQGESCSDGVDLIDQTLQL